MLHAVLLLVDKCGGFVSFFLFIYLTGPSSVEPVLYLKCHLDQILEENLKVPVINDSRERALAIAAQQQMSTIEYERRKITGTLQSSSVRVATALLGLSRVEVRNTVLLEQLFSGSWFVCLSF